MKKKKNLLSAVTILTLMLFMVFAPHRAAQASSTYMDGKLTISGFVKQQMQIRTEMPAAERQFHSTNVDFFQTSGLLETLYKIRDCPDYSISFFGGVKAWWQESIYYDHKMSNAIPRDERQSWTMPRDFDKDVLTEAYIDIIKGPWQFRLGKQILVWGQLDLERVADVVNPLDIRRGPPGVNTWEEVKMGLWMIRTLYQSELPGNLLFETVINPGDFTPMELPYEGTQPGVAASQVRFFDPRTRSSAFITGTGKNGAVMPRIAGTCVKTGRSASGCGATPGMLTGRFSTGMPVMTRRLPTRKTWAVHQ